MYCGLVRWEACSIFAPMLDNHEARLPGVAVLARFLEVVAAHGPAA